MTRCDTVTVMEQWRQVVGYEGLYEVSSEGRVFSKYTEYPLSPTADRQGYLTVSLTDLDGKVSNHKVHRLVMAAFRGASDLYVLHANDNPADNRLENLRYGTQKDNQADAAKRGRRPTGENHVNSKLSDWQKRKIAERVAQGEKRSALVEQYGVTNTTISRIIADSRYAWPGHDYAPHELWERREYNPDTDSYWFFRTGDVKQVTREEFNAW